MFSRADMAAFALKVLEESAQPITIERMTVPGVKDLPVACQRLFEEKKCDIVMAFGFIGKERIDQVCGHEASLSIQAVQLKTGKHILEVFVHEDEAVEPELVSIIQNRCEKHAQNAIDLLFFPEKLMARAGTGERQGKENAKPLSVYALQNKKTDFAATIGIVVAEFNGDITSQMLEVALQTAKGLNLRVKRVVHVPGSLEIPLAAKQLLRDTEIAGVACLGVVKKGETEHDRVVAHTSVRKLVDLSLEYNKPVGIGISGPGITLEQARARIDSFGKNSVETVFKMLQALKRE